MNILETIVAHKREEVAASKGRVKTSALSSMEFFSRKTISLVEGLRKPRPFAVIAEVKRASPTAGMIRKDADSSLLAREYESNGAAAISVLTDERFFSGVLDDLRRARQAAALPILRKDFIFDEYQLFEAKAYGADAILLIAAVLDKTRLSDLFAAARELQLECLVELYGEKELDLLDLDRMKLVGVNNRDLRTFDVDVTRSITVARLLPRDVTVVSESGIHGAGDLRKLRSAGIKAALIGEHLMGASNPGHALRALLDDLDDKAKS